MLTTENIKSGFDLELHLGSDWLKTALGIILSDRADSFPIAPSIINLRFLEGNEWDIHAVIFPLPDPVRARISISSSGNSLDVETDNALFPDLTIPLPRLANLAGAPRLVKVIGDAGMRSALVLLANLNLRASPQSGDPLPEGSHFARGSVANTVALLPAGQSIALGIPAATIDRFANHIWHTNLRNADGEHLIMDGTARRGVWKSVEGKIEGERILLKVKGEADIDNDILDFFVDANITATIDLRPMISSTGSIRFELQSDINVDTGLMGDFLAFLTGGLLAGPLALLTGGLIAPGLLSVGAVVALEVGEAVVAGEIERRVFGAGDAVPDPVQVCQDGMIQQSIPPAPEAEFTTNLLDTIPSDITILQDDDAPLYRHLQSVDAVFGEQVINDAGLAFSGSVEAGDRFIPHPVELERVHYDGETFLGFTYRVPSGTDRNFLTKAEIVERIATSSIPTPLGPRTPYEDGTFTRYDGKLVPLCLTPEAIHRVDTVVTHFRFPGGHVIAVADCVELQLANAIHLPGLQLIQPIDDRPYFRSPPDSSEDNNLENLPTFDLP